MRKDARSPLEMEGQIGFSGNVQDSSFSSVITSYGRYCWESMSPPERYSCIQL